MLSDCPSNESSEICENVKGAIGYDLSPINLILSVVILIVNPIIIKCYADQRKWFSASMYIAIAITDIVAAQGGIIISIAGMLLVDNRWDIGQRVLYCLYYYAATAGLAQTCSKYYNVVLSVVITINTHDPLRRLNFKRIRHSVATLTAIFFLLHLGDGISLVYVEVSEHYQYLNRNLNGSSLLTINFPGAFSCITVVCLGFDSQKCKKHHGKLLEIPLTMLIFLVNVALPPLLFLFSTILLAIFLKRAVREYESGFLNSRVRQVSTTVLLLATLSVVCHCTLAAVIILLYCKFVITGKKVPYHAREMGTIIGFAAITLPLLNAALFPLILIARNPTLRQRFIEILFVLRDVPRDYWTRFKGIFSLNVDASSYNFLYQSMNRQ